MENKKNVMDLSIIKKILDQTPEVYSLKKEFRELTKRGRKIRNAKTDPYDSDLEPIIEKINVKRRRVFSSLYEDYGEKIIKWVVEDIIEWYLNEGSDS